MDHSHHDHAHHDHSQHMHAMNNISLTSTTAPAIVSDHAHHAHHNHADMTMGDGSGGGAHSMHHMMSMAFHFGCNETILFEQWRTESVGGLIGSMIAIFVMATLYEGLKYYREYLFWKTYNLLQYRPVAMPKSEISTNSATIDQQTAAEANAMHSVHFVGEVMHKQPPSIFSLMHFYQTMLHLVQVTLSFLLMLIFMTYNVWLCIAVVLGAGFGYYLFCWKKSVIVDVTEHCH